MPVAVASLLLGQLHHKPSECEVVVAHSILTVRPPSEQDLHGGFPPMNRLPNHENDNLVSGNAISNGVFKKSA